jgi:hypothetical protein
VDRDDAAGRTEEVRCRVSVRATAWVIGAMRFAGQTRIFFTLQPRRQMSLHSLPVLAQQPLEVQHTRPLLARVPRWPRPPVCLTRCLQLKLQQPQHRQTDPQRLTRPFDRQPRPRPTLLPAQPLFEVPETILLPEAGTEQLHDLQTAQRQRRTHQREPLAVPLHFIHHRLDDHVPTRHPPLAEYLLPTHVPHPAIHKGPPLLPLARPTPALTRRRQTAAPATWPSRAAGGLGGRRPGVQGAVRTQPGQDVQAWRPAIFGPDQRPVSPRLPTEGLRAEIAS